MIPQSALHSPKAPVPQRMLDFLISHAAANDGVTREDLLCQFTGEQIDKHFDEAKKLAGKKGFRQ